MSTILTVALLFANALSDPAPTSGNYSPAAASIVVDTTSFALSTTAAPPPAKTSFGPSLNIVLSTLDCTTWPSKDCTTTSAQFQVVNNLSYALENPVTAFNSIQCNRALSKNEQLDISAVVSGADPATGKVNRQYPGVFTGKDWQCERFLESVMGDLSKCQTVTGTCCRLWTPNGAPKEGLHKSIPKIGNNML